MNKPVLFRPPYRRLVTWAIGPTTDVLEAQGAMHLRIKGLRHKSGLARQAMLDLRLECQAPMPRPSDRIPPRIPFPFRSLEPAIPRKDLRDPEPGLSLFRPSPMTELSKAFSRIPLHGSFETEIEQKSLELLTQTLMGVDNRPTTSLQAVKSAAETINTWALRDQAEQGDMDGFLWTFWGVLFDVVKVAPADHPAQDTLVSILRCLQARRTIAVMAWHIPRSLWADLPLFGPVAREAWNSQPWGEGDPPLEEDAAEAIGEWINLNMFIARITAGGIRDFQTYGIGEIIAALESELEPRVLHYSLDIASRWILVCGKQMYQGAAEGDPLEGWNGWTSPGPLYAGKVGLCIERWRFWLGRFEELRGVVPRDVSVKVQEAVECMKALE